MKKLSLLICATLFLESCAELNSVLDSVNKTMEGVSNQNVKPVSGVKICNDFVDNEIMAKKLWNGSHVSIKGKIDSIYQDEWGNSNINVKVNHKTRVLATLRKGYNTDKLRRGHSVNIKGTVSNVVHSGTCNILLDRASL
uniref:Uncharacterized protein n=1 Tax=Histophilus somni (strain 129Pt) TaxID=205914 RepID=Q0I2P1_HISS1